VDTAGTEVNSTIFFAVQIRVSALSPLLRDQLQRFPPLKAATLLGDAEYLRRTGAARSTAKYRWRIVRVPQLDYWILVGKPSLRAVLDDIALRVQT
jgi:hypothetical protein